MNCEPARECGVTNGVAGCSAPDTQGNWSDLDVEVGILARNSTLNLTRDASLGLSFTTINYYDGGLSIPWPVREDGAFWPSHFEWPELTTFNVTGGAALSPDYLTIVFGLGLYTAAFTRCSGPMQRPAARYGMAPAGA